MLEIYGTFGPACHDSSLIAAMLEAGMNGMRLNCSHGPLQDSLDWADALKEASEKTGRPCSFLIDLQGRELRILDMPPLSLLDGDFVSLMEDIPLSKDVYEIIEKGDVLLLDDGKIVLEVLEKPLCAVLRGGTLTSRKGLKIKDRTPDLPAVRSQDLANLAIAAKAGVTGVMVPFVQKKEDLIQIRQILDHLELPLKIYAKIENRIGADHLEELFDYCDVIVIARGDLANDCSLIRLPSLQKEIEERCLAAGKPYLVVTEMLDSMKNHPVCTRAEANDVWHAVYNGASGIMLTGETASGKYPLEAMQTFCQLAADAQKYQSPQELSGQN